jgi:hypothetical protein
MNIERQIEKNTSVTLYIFTLFSVSTYINTDHKSFQEHSSGLQATCSVLDNTGYLLMTIRSDRYLISTSDVRSVTRHSKW